MRRLLPLLLLLLPALAGATVSTTHAHVDVTATGSTQSNVSITFEFFGADHITVADCTDDTCASESALVEGIDYEVDARPAASALPATGTLDIIDAVTAGHTIRIRRVIPVEQVVNLITAGRYDPGSIEKGLDLLTMMIQQLEEGTLPTGTYEHGSLSGGSLHAEVIRGDHTVDNSGTCGFMCGDNYDLLLDHVDDVGTGTVSATNPHGTSPLDIGLYYDVKAYGALGNGVADDTAEIQEAIDDASVVGGVVYFPPGTYIVSNVSSSGNIFTLSSPDVTLKGAGRNVSIIKSSAAMLTGHKQFVVTAARVVFEDLGFSAATSAAASTGIYFSGAVNGEVHRSRVGAAFGWSIQVYDNSQHVVISEVESTGTGGANNFEIKESSYTLIDKCDITGNLLSPQNGVEIYDGAAHPTVGNVVRNTWIHSVGSSGVASFGTVDTLIEGNTIEGATVAGVYVTNSEEAPATRGSGVSVRGDNKIRGTLSGGAGGIYVTDAFGGTGPADVAIEGNTVTTSGGTVPGIYVQGTTTRFKIIGNTVKLNGGHGIFVNSGHAMVIGNVVNDNSQVGVAARNGISIEASAVDAQVISNECSDIVGSTTQFGVYNAGTNSVIIGNRAFGVANLGYYSVGSGSVTYGNRQDAGGGIEIPDRTIATVLPPADNTKDLGSTAARWRAAYIASVKDAADTIRVGTGATAGNFYKDAIASPGGASIAHTFDTVAAYSTAGGLLATFKNNGSVENTIDKDGKLLTIALQTPVVVTGNVQTGSAADVLLAGLATAGVITDSSTAVGSVQAQAVVATTPNTAAVTCDSVMKGMLLYVDDSDDTAVSFLCFCGTQADDTTYSWRRADGGGACP